MSLSRSRERAPTRSTRPCVARHVDDRRRLGPGGRPVVQDHRDRAAQHLRGRVGVRRGGHPAAVGAADRERAGAREQLEGDVVVGHPHRDGPPGVAEVPLQRRLLVAHQGQRAGPQLGDQRPGVRRHPDGQRVERGGRRDQHRWRHLAAAALRGEQPLHRLRVEGVGADAVHRVGGQHDELAALHREGGLGDAGLALGLLGRPEPGCGLAVRHTGHRASRAVVQRGRPARSRWSRTSDHRPARGEDARRGLALHVRVLGADHPAGTQQPRRDALQDPQRVEPVVPGEQRQVRGRGRGPPPRRTRRPPAGCRAGCTAPRRRCRRGRRTRRPCRRGAGRRPVPARLRAAHSPAASPSSTACTSAAGTSVATASATAPEPVQRSTTTGARPASSTAWAASTPQPASSSVSGRGTNTPGPTASST